MHGSVQICTAIPSEKDRLPSKLIATKPRNVLSHLRLGFYIVSGTRPRSRWCCGISVAVFEVQGHFWWTESNLRNFPIGQRRERHQFQLCAPDCVTCHITESSHRLRQLQAFCCLKLRRLNRRVKKHRKLVSAFVFHPHHALSQAALGPEKLPHASMRGSLLAFRLSSSNDVGGATAARLRARALIALRALITRSPGRVQALALGGFGDSKMYLYSWCRRNYIYLYIVSIYNSKLCVSIFTSYHMIVSYLISCHFISYHAISLNVLYCITYCIALHLVLYHIISYCIVLDRIVSCCIVLDYKLLYCIVLLVLLCVRVFA